VPVKSDGSTHRQRQAQATREQVAAAARALFAERGYVAATITAIAEAADIPAPTIYSAFGSKKKILDEVVRLWIAASDVQRLHDEALAQPDPAQRVRVIAHFQRLQLDHGLDVILIYQEAARTDPQMASAWRNVLAGRERALGELVVSLEGDLAPGLDTKGAIDRFLTCTLAEIYSMLVQERGWSPEQYERWLGDLLIDQLLGTRGRA